MLDCWDEQPTRRPSFANICSLIAAILESATANYGYVVAVKKDYLLPDNSVTVLL